MVSHLFPEDFYAKYMFLRFYTDIPCVIHVFFRNRGSQHAYAFERRIDIIYIAGVYCSKSRNTDSENKTGTRALQWTRLYSANQAHMRPEHFGISRRSRHKVQNEATMQCHSLNDIFRALNPFPSSWISKDWDLRWTVMFCSVYLASDSIRRAHSTSDFLHLHSLRLCCPCNYQHGFLPAKEISRRRVHWTAKEATIIFDVCKNNKRAKLKQTRWLLGRKKCWFWRPREQNRWRDSPFAQW